MGFLTVDPGAGEGATRGEGCAMAGWVWSFWGRDPVQCRGREGGTGDMMTNEGWKWRIPHH